MQKSDNEASIILENLPRSSIWAAAFVLAVMFAGFSTCASIETHGISKVRIEREKTRQMQIQHSTENKFR